eukprot:jgi/Botrbrau1/3956/Bobra.0365s0030.2
MSHPGSGSRLDNEKVPAGRTTDDCSLQGMEFSSLNSGTEIRDINLPLGLEEASTSYINDDGVANGLIPCDQSGTTEYGQGLGPHQPQSLRLTLASETLSPQDNNGQLQNCTSGLLSIPPQHFCTDHTIMCCRIPMHKQCSKCKSTKESNDFFKDKSKPDGLYSQCKVCSATEERRRQEMRVFKKPLAGTTKTCKRCLEEKEIEAFCQNKRSSDGHYSQCRTCVSNKDRARRLKVLSSHPQVVPHKKCSRCGNNKPSEEFYKDASKPDGLQTYCKPCLSARNRERREGKARAAQPEGEASSSMEITPVYPDQTLQTPAEGHGVPDLHYYSGPTAGQPMPHLMPNQVLEMQPIPVQGVITPLVHNVHSLEAGPPSLEHTMHLSNLFPLQGPASQLSPYTTHNVIHAAGSATHIMGTPSACVGFVSHELVLAHAMHSPQQLPIPSPQVNQQPPGHGQNQVPVHSLHSHGHGVGLHLSTVSHHPEHAVLHNEVPQAGLQPASQSSAAHSQTCTIIGLPLGSSQQQASLTGQAPGAPEQILVKTKSPAHSPQQGSAKHSPLADEEGLEFVGVGSPTKGSALPQPSEMLLRSRGSSADAPGAGLSIPMMDW